LAQHTKPAVFEAAVVGVEVDGFAVGEADPEALLDVGVGLVFFGEGGFATAFGFGFGGRSWIGDEGVLVVD
jgi:hypothetical protein